MQMANPNATRLLRRPAKGARLPVLGVFHICLLTLMVLAISRAYSYFGVLRMMRPAMLLVMFAVGYWILKPKRVEVANLARSWHARVVLALVIVACLSVPFGISIGHAGKFMITDYWKTVLLFPLMLLTIRGAADLRRLVWAAVIGAGLLVWLSLFVFGISKTQGSYGYDANDIGCVIVTILPLAVLAAQGARKWGTRLLAVAILLGMVDTVVKSQSRGAFVGLIVTVAIMLLTVRSVSIIKRVMIVGAMALALTFSAGQNYWALMKSLQSPTEDYNWNATYGRKQLAKRGIGYMWSHPLFGVGIDNFPMAEVTISPVAKNFVDQRGVYLRVAAAHDSHIQVASELGLTGLVLWVMLWGGAFVTSVRVRGRMPKSWKKKGAGDERFLYLATYYIPVAVVGFLVTATFVSFAYHDLTYLLLAVVAAVPVATDRQLDGMQALPGTSALGRHGTVTVRGRRRAPTAALHALRGNASGTNRSTPRLGSTNSTTPGR